MKAADKEAISVCFHKTMKAAKVSDEIAKLFSKGIFSHSFGSFVGKADTGCFTFKDGKIIGINSVGHLLELMGYKPPASFRDVGDCVANYFAFDLLIGKIKDADYHQITEHLALLIRYLKQFNEYSRQREPADNTSPTLFSICRILKNIGSVFKKYVL